MTKKAYLNPITGDIWHEDEEAWFVWTADEFEFSYDTPP